MESDVQFRQAATIISSLFSLATLIVYAILPELHNMHGLAIICYMACTFVSFILTEILEKILPAVVEPLSFLCIVTVCSTHFVWLCINSWLGVLCFDIFWTFSGIVNRFGTEQEQRAWITLIEKQESIVTNNASMSLTTGDDQPSNSSARSESNSTIRVHAGERRRFYKYSMFGWGIPLILVVFTQILEYTETLPEWFVRPGFRETCWFTYLEGIFYVITPSLVLYLISLTVALIAACYLRGKDCTIRENATPRVRAVILSTLTSIVPRLAEIPVLFSEYVGAAMLRFASEILVAALVFVLYISQRHVLRLLYKRCLPLIRLWRRTVPTILACYCCDKYGRIESDEP